MDDEVLEIIKGGGNNPNGYGPGNNPSPMSCNESGVAGVKDEGTTYLQETVLSGGQQTTIQLRFTYKVDYNKYGVYFSMFSQIKCHKFKDPCSIDC